MQAFSKCLIAYAFERNMYASDVCYRIRLQLDYPLILAEQNL